MLDLILVKKWSSNIICNKNRGRREKKEKSFLNLKYYNKGWIHFLVFQLHIALRIIHSMCLVISQDVKLKSWRHKDIDTTTLWHYRFRLHLTSINDTKHFVIDELQVEYSLIELIMLTGSKQQGLIVPVLSIFKI